MALLAGEDCPLALAIGDALRVAGWAVRRDLDGARELDLVLWLATGRPATIAEAGASLVDALLTARDTQALLERAGATPSNQNGHSGRRAAFMTLTRLDGRLGLSEVDTLEHAVLGGLPGLVKTLAIEAPSLYCRALDLAPQLSERRCAELVLAELADSVVDLAQVGYDAGEVRWTVSLEPPPKHSFPLEANSIPPKHSFPLEARSIPQPLWTAGQEITEPGPGDLLVVTGGGRGITAACVTGLARRYGCGLLLLGRTRLTGQPAWAGDVPADGLRAAVAGRLMAEGTRPTPHEVERIYRDLAAAREIERTLAQIRDGGGHAEYLSVDIADADAGAVADALAAYRSRITGVVHGAGVLADQVIADKRAEDVSRVLAPKLDGLHAVLAALDCHELRHVVLFSSVAGFFGNRGQADYAMANEALNRMAGVLQRRHPNAAVTAINWGAWDGGMVTPELARMFSERGVALIPLADGVEAFVDQFRPARSRDLVCVVGPATTPPPVRAARPLPGGTLVLHRDLAPIAGHPVLADHAVDGLPVLPATVAIGAMLNVVGRFRPEVRTLTGFAVLKGLVFHGEPGVLRLRLSEEDGPDSVAVLAFDESNRPRYQAVLSSAGPPPVPVITGLPRLKDGEPVTAYTDGTLFHGPALRGLRRLTGGAAGRMVFSCQLTDSALADGGYATESYSPVLADLLLQAALVWVRRRRGLASLPVAIGGVECHVVLPDDEPFFVVVEQSLSAGARVRCTVTACSRDGRVLLRFRDVDLVCSQTLASKFGLASVDAVGA